MLNTSITTLSMTLFITASYLLCVLFGILTPDAVHMHTFLESVLPAFRWLDPLSFALGLVESMLWGAYLGFGFSFTHNFVYRRFGKVS